MITRLAYVAAIALGSVLLATTTVNAQASATLEAGSSEGTLGDLVSIPVKLDGSEIECAGFSFGLTHDDTVLEIDSISQGESLGELNDGEGPGFWITDIEVDGGAGGIVACLTADLTGSTDLESLPSDDELEIAVFTYTISLDAEVGDEAEIEFTDELAVAPGDPEVAVVVTDLATDVDLTLEDGDVEVLSGYVSIVLPPGSSFVRGDVDAEGNVDINDAIDILSYGFSGGDHPECLDSADIDDNGEISPLIDAIGLLNWLFLDGDAPPAPSDCDVDPTHDNLECESFSGCS